MIVRPKVRGFVCITAHPVGCQAHVDEQIQYIEKQFRPNNGPKNVLIIGASTGYGLSSRITAAFGYSANTLGILFDRPANNGRPASAGWYNTAAFEKAASKRGLYAKSINGDAFTNEVKKAAFNAIQKDIGKIDLVIYSLAAPVRIDPKTGLTHRSILKPIGSSFTAKTLDTDKDIVAETSIGPATQKDIDDTVKVMGGEDWELWIDGLQQSKLLAPGAITIAYSYIGPEVTWPIYANGTIGNAKNNLLDTARRLDQKLASNGGGRALVSFNKAVVTQASSAIPVVPLYLSILIKVMKEKSIHEDCIQQIHRLFCTHLYNEETIIQDQQCIIRIDDLEMKDEVQGAVKDIWKQVCTSNLKEITGYSDYKNNFLKLFGFGIHGIDYEEPVQIEVDINNLSE